MMLSDRGIARIRGPRIAGNSLFSSNFLSHVTNQLICDCHTLNILLQPALEMLIGDFVFINGGKKIGH